MKEGKINIVTRLENTIKFPFLLSSEDHRSGPTAGDTPGVSTFSNFAQTGACPTNTQRGQEECPYKLQWKSRCNGGTEDIVKHECLPATETAILGLKCEYQVCRLLCTTPSFEISDGWSLDQFESLTPGATGIPFGVCDLVDGKRPDRCYKLLVKLHVGKELKFELKADSVISDDRVDVQGAVEPGIPIGMDFSDAGAEPGKGSKTRTVRWTPHPGQQGKTHIASFVAFIPQDDYFGANCPLYMRRVHIQIDVEAYITFWKLPVLPDAVFKRIIVGEKPTDDVHSGETGSDIVFSVTSGQQVEGLELMCKSNVAKEYMPVIALHNVSIDGVAQEGKCTETSCSAASHLAGWSGFGTLQSPGLSADRYKAFDFQYMSVAGKDEGFEKRWCFSCADTGNMYPPAVQCITIRTRLCEVYVENGDSLEAITRKYHLDRNWRRLWNLNSQLTNPYTILHGDSTLRYGPLYTVRAGDSMVTIAARFETTIKKLLSVNPHIDEADEINPGEDVCVLPCSDRQPPSHFRNTQYTPRQ